MRRVHGGAIRTDKSIKPFEQRVNKDSTRKQAIAKEALQFLQTDQVIYIDSGTTNELQQRNTT